MIYFHFVKIWYNIRSFIFRRNISSHEVRYHIADISPVPYRNGYHWGTLLYEVCLCKWQIFLNILPYLICNRNFDLKKTACQLNGVVQLFTTNLKREVVTKKRRTSAREMRVEALDWFGWRALFLMQRFSFLNSRGGVCPPESFKTKR